jgi:hypothetical protein
MAPKHSLLISPEISATFVKGYRSSHFMAFSESESEQTLPWSVKEDFLFFKHQRSLDALKISARNGCWFCAHIALPWTTMTTLETLIPPHFLGYDSAWTLRKQEFRRCLNRF